MISRADISTMPPKKKKKAARKTEGYPIPAPVMQYIREQMKKEAEAKARKARKPAKGK
ncbi:MAG: hypothetical protein ACKOY8_08910 [Verrucomicrobiota bacterium]